MKHATKNTHGCCDGTGQVHHVAGDNPHYVGPLSYIALCHDKACMARRAAAWDRECEPVTDEMVERATAAVVAAHDGEMRAYLAGEIEANTWRPEVYAKAALAGALVTKQRPEETR